MAKCLYHIHHRDHCFLHFCQVITTANHLYRHKRTYAIMHPYQSRLLHQCQTVLYRVKTCFASIGKGMFHRKAVFLAKLLPKVLLFPWKHYYDLKCFVISPEYFQGMHQHRFITHGKELFREVTSHSQALSTGDNDYIFLHGRFSV